MFTQAICNPKSAHLQFVICNLLIRNLQSAHLKFEICNLQSVTSRSLFKTMTIDPLWAISPVDGRYRRQTEELAEYFSEGALIRYRLRVETEYFIALCKLPLPQLKGVSESDFKKLRETFYQQYSPADAARVKEIEKTTNHDVKAVE